MITVSILINGQPLFTRTAVRQIEPSSSNYREYLLDTGETISHNPKKGAIPLAIKMLKTIKEQL